MHVETIALKDFRNYPSLELSFSEETNLLIGENAQGKTNILESIYLCGTSKSHRQARDRDMIRFGCSESHIRAMIRSKDISSRLDIHLRAGKAKGIAIDGQPIRRFSQLMGLLNVICFSPEDLSMVKDGPAGRRRFLDMELCQLDRVYFHDLSAYAKIISQRNALLRQIPFDPSLRDTLDIWDMQLVSCGKKLIRERRKFTEALNQTASSVHRKLTSGKERLTVSYLPSVNEEDFEERLLLMRETDLKMKTTGLGPHRDDILLQSDGVDLRKFGSQGQQRTAALSLKLSEIELVRKRTGDRPVLLLDDVLSELDGNRQRDLLESIHGIQTLITCAGDYRSIEKYVKIDRMFEVHGGVCHERKI